jgi:type IV secretory pathway TrbF-like protein
MRFLKRRRAAAVEAAGPGAASDPYRRRYDIAREGYEMRTAQLARALDQATLKVYLCAAGNIVLGIGIVTIALRGGVRPVFIPHDELGRVIRYDDLSRFRDPPRALVESQLGEWLVNARGIYYGDPVAQLDRGRAATRLLAPAAAQWLDAYFAPPARNPGRLLRELSRTVHVVSISRDPERSLWYLQWREVEVSRRGPQVESAWQGTLEVEFVPAATEEEAWKNPAGIVIRSIDWHRLREHGPAASGGAPSAPPPAAPPS